MLSGKTVETYSTVSPIDNIGGAQLCRITKRLLKDVSSSTPATSYSARPSKAKVMKYGLHVTGKKPYRRNAFTSKSATLLPSLLVTQPLRPSKTLSVNWNLQCLA